MTRAEALELSPFTVRAGKNVTNLNPIAFKEKNEPENEDANKVVEKSPIWTIEGITQRNLEPSITQGEHKEYKR